MLKSIERFPLSCGEVGWAAVHQIAHLLPLARSKQVPIIYSTRASDLTRYDRTLITRKEELEKTRIGNEIVREIAPAKDDIVIGKLNPSVFFGTPLISILNLLRVDTLIFCGCITSSCVRASVFDAASYRFRIAVVKECTFDRCEITHKINLFDMNAKYARVVSISEVKEYLAGLPNVNKTT